MLWKIWGRRIPRPPRRYRPRLEHLEHRCVPAQVLDGGTLLQETFDDVNAATFPGTGTFDDTGALPGSAAQVLFDHNFGEGFLENGGDTVPAAGQTAQDFLAVTPDTITLHPLLPPGEASAQAVIGQAAIDVRINASAGTGVVGTVTFVGLGNGERARETLQILATSGPLISGGAGTSLSGTTVTGWTTVAANQDDIVREDMNGIFYKLGPISQIIVSGEIDRVQTLVTLPPTIALSSSSDPSVLGQPITFTAHIENNGDSIVPTGSITFQDGATMLGMAALDNGQAQLTTTLALGNHNITAVYGGDANYSAITSSALAQTVRQPESFLWTGTDLNGLWSDPLNWSGNQAPAPGDRLVFPPDAMAHDLTNDFPPDSFFQSLTFNFAGSGYGVPGNYHMQGNAILLGTGGILDQQLAQIRLGMDIGLSGPTVITVQYPPSPSLELDGVLFDAPGSSGGLIKAGIGILTLGGDNRYSGPTIIHYGTLALTASTALGQGPVSVSASATLFLEALHGPIAPDNPLLLFGVLQNGGDNSWAATTARQE